MGEKSVNACVALILARYLNALQFIKIDEVLLDLFLKKIVTYTEYLEVINRKSEEKFLFLLKCLPQSGDGAFSIFVEVLRNKNHIDLANNLERELKQALKEDEDAKATPASDSHQLPTPTSVSKKRLGEQNADGTPPSEKRTCLQADVAFQGIQEPHVVCVESVSLSAATACDGQVHTRAESNCQCGNHFEEVASPTECQRIDGFDIRENLKTVPVVSDRENILLIQTGPIEIRAFCSEKGKAALIRDGAPNHTAGFRSLPSKRLGLGLEEVPKELSMPPLPKRQ
ncbi:unnamed protein product [Darwinula stevensoni]|uniref:CARD domain-containing protein n=1 Tax=Darwinula stevensoni TaxID=69355 RepID=A0A7R9A645_9CRUS|nr:unnamed protein product [Darwinula stevensoni]CAG0893405.1 unnamed protein product [Darwinula stevensoni]